jgi:hypothetical protein
MPISDHERFRDLNFEDFRRLANDPNISKYNRIGFPDSYRDGYERAILRDIRDKLPGLDTRGQVVLDIGPGCSDLPLWLVDLCREHSHTLIQIDSAEMLSHLPDHEFVRKIEGSFPDCKEALNTCAHEGVDIILCYSVLHYIFAEHDLGAFATAAATHLRPGGAMLLGDIPNVSKRKRFFSSEQGKQFHRIYSGVDEDPVELAAESEDGKINDAVILDLLAIFRKLGTDAYVVPQADDLPMANRREDILIRKN